jgi:hypothetical protein
MGHMLFINNSFFFKKTWTVVIFLFGLLKFKLKKFLLNKRVLRSYQDSQVILAAEKIKAVGYFVVEDFIDSKECALLRKEIDNLLSNKNYSHLVRVDPEGADKRFFGAECYSSLIHKYTNSHFIKCVAEEYFKGSMECATTLAAKINYVSDNKGSGGGWHYDAPYFEFKSLLYLSDVDIKNGPFHFIKESHRLKSKIKYLYTTEYDGASLRLNDDDVSRIIKNNPELYKIMAAKKGTLILVDTSMIHSGMPISTGCRYSLFNYFYPSYYDIGKIRSMYNSRTD